MSRKQTQEEATRKTKIDAPNLFFQKVSFGKKKHYLISIISKSCDKLFVAQETFLDSKKNSLTKISKDWENWVERTKERNPMKRVTTPEDVAGLVSLLLNDKADFVNCSTIFCDGGEHRSL